MILITDLIATWNAITPLLNNSVMRRADISHPLDFFIGYDENCNLQLMLICNTLPVLPESSRHIDVKGNHRGDGKYAVCFSLLRNELRDMFISLSWDIIDSTFHSTDEKFGVNSAVKRFSMWQILLAESDDDRMPGSVVKGLLGELLVLKKICLPTHGKEKTIAGWTGPLKSDRDFEIDNTWYEVKAVSLSSQQVHISSLDQLDTDKEGNLIICRLEKISSAVNEKVSLNSLIQEIEDELQEFPYELTLFRMRLKLAGFNSDDQEQADEAYKLHRFELFRVSQGFPSLRRSSLPAALNNAEYTLNIAALQSWGIT